jgi:hypothetical protein
LRSIPFSTAENIHKSKSSTAIISPFLEKKPQLLHVYAELAIQRPGLETVPALEVLLSQQRHSELKSGACIAQLCPGLAGRGAAVPGVDTGELTAQLLAH